MINNLYAILQLGAAGRVAEKAAHMAEIDPHGTTLTIVSVTMVFFALILLYIAYSITGAIFTKKRQLKKTGKRLMVNKNGKEDEEIAAIAAALQAYMDEDEVHDVESGIITIHR